MYRMFGELNYSGEVYLCFASVFIKSIYALTSLKLSIVVTEITVHLFRRVSAGIENRRIWEQYVELKFCCAYSSTMQKGRINTAGAVCYGHKEHLY